MEVYREDGRPECDCTDTEVRKRVQKNGKVAVRQCLTCGAHKGNVPAKTVRMWELNEWDQPLQDSWNERVQEHWRNQAADRQNQWHQQRDREAAEWWARYDQHMASAKWRQTADKVLKRDNYQCRGCGERRAIHVHHLSYQHVGDELLFELVSLCPGCHQKCHPDRSIVPYVGKLRFTPI